MNNFLGKRPTLKLNVWGIIGSIIVPILFLLFLYLHPDYDTSGGNTPRIITSLFSISYLIALTVSGIIFILGSSIFGSSVYYLMTKEFWVIFIFFITMGTGYFIGSIFFYIWSKIFIANKSKEGMKRFHINIFLYALFLSCTLLLFRSALGATTVRSVEMEEDQRKSVISFDHISFSNDGQRILFERKKGNSLPTINAYNLKSNELSTYQPPQGEYWTMARYSHDDKYIVFCIQRGSSPLQIGIIDSDGKNFRQITQSTTGGEHPSFSHSDDKIIFVKPYPIKESVESAPINEKGPRYDIYETDLKNGSETRLTWFNLHYIISTPFELPDGETIIFSAVGPPEFTPEWDGRSYMVKKGDKLLPDPFVVPGNKNPLLSSKESTKNPLVSNDGKRIVFQGLALRPNSKHTDCQQYFEYSTTGIYRRITHIPIPDSCIVSADLSPDGQYLAIVFEINSGRNEMKRIAICNIQDGKYREINLPDKPSRIINVQRDRTAEPINPADPTQAPGS